MDEKRFGAHIPRTQARDSDHLQSQTKPPGRVVGNRSTLPCSAEQYSAVQRSTVQHRAVQYVAVQRDRAGDWRSLVLPTSVSWGGGAEQDARRLWGRRGGGGGHHHGFDATTPVLRCAGADTCGGVQCDTIGPHIRPLP